MSEGLPPQTLGFLDPGRVAIARTASKSMLGCMNEMARYLDVATLQHGGVQHSDAAELSRGLRRALQRGPDYIVPLEVVQERAARQSALN